MFWWFTNTQWLFGASYNKKKQQQQQQRNKSKSHTYIQLYGEAQGTLLHSQQQQQRNGMYQNAHTNDIETCCLGKKNAILQSENNKDDSV